MSEFDPIRPFYDAEVNAAIHQIIDDPMLKAMMQFIFPEDKSEAWKDRMRYTHSLRDFQINFIYPGVKKVLERSSEGLSVGGFDQLEPNTAYLFISNHRDIILDTSLLNACLYEQGLVMTTSAIGDNLIKKPFIHLLSKLNRNFAIRRGVTGRTLLESSLLVSQFIHKSLLRENRSVWTAQREGRTKDGNDLTQKGVLKMLTLAENGSSPFGFFEKIRLVPVSISYEYDPTDSLKIPELLAKSREETYVKSENEDFITLLSGIMGAKKRIHIQVTKVLDQEIKVLNKEPLTQNEKLGKLAELIDFHIWKGYKLWPSNYIAHDLLHQQDRFVYAYTPAEKLAFEKRVAEKVEANQPLALENFLKMYANPVENQLQSAGN
ncbi:MAG: 1-acyl-sn-glycerol-3-phosphate acyltransferase [Algoriphagus sp.]